MSTFRTIWTTEDRYIEVIDQRVLPHELVHVKLMNYRDADLAIRSMTVRGAPLIGATFLNWVVKREKRPNKKTFFRLQVRHRP